MTFAASDALRVTSENDVLVLLSTWVKGRDCSEAQLTALSNVVRVVHLTSGYLSSLASLVPWFKVHGACSWHGWRHVSSAWQGFTG